MASISEAPGQPVPGLANPRAPQANHSDRGQRNRHIRPDMGPNTCSRNERKNDKGVGEGKRGRLQSRGRPIRKLAKRMTDASTHHRRENLAKKKQRAKKSKLAKNKRGPKTQQNIF